MAKFGSYYSLCPIIDQKSLLGINEDSESDHVLVTLGKNIAIKYKLSDQKQIVSWRTKEKFTSPVIYYKEEDKYCAVFNQTYLRTWDSSDEKLDKVKKIKFNKQIYTLLNCKGNPYIVFSNGAISPLQAALENRKDLDCANVIDPKTETISDVLSISVGEKFYIGLLMKQSDNIKLIWTVYKANKELYTNSIETRREDLILNGNVLIQDGLDDVTFLTLWSDGKVWSHSLKDEENTDKKGNYLTTIELISCKDYVTMFPLNEDYIAMYGANRNEEGASLIIYNIQFKVTQSQQNFKMFTSGTKLWCCLNNLFLCIGQHLAVVPYHLDMEQLAALVGSHKAVTSDPDIAIVQDLVVAVWEDKCQNQNNEVIKGIEALKHFEESSFQGWSDAAICDELIPKYIESKDIAAINSALEYFKDIPESHIANLVNFVLSSDSKLFHPEMEENNKLPPNLGPMDRGLLIDKILLLSFSDVLLLPQLRKHLEFPNALLLIRYICYLLSEDGHWDEDNTLAKKEEKIIEWGCLLLDANYQSLLLSKDNKIIEILTYFNSLVSMHLCCLEELQRVNPVLISVKQGISFANKSNDSLRYSIEKLKLY